MVIYRLGAMNTRRGKPAATGAAQRWDSWSRGVWVTEKSHMLSPHVADWL